jgi:tripartite-type tricarboxylate transporter receptor subunit TctC
LSASKGAPPEIEQKINTDVQKIFLDPDFKRKFLDTNSINVRPGTVKEFAAYVNAEAFKWSKVIKQANLQANKGKSSNYWSCHFGQAKPSFNAERT